jgi:uncharacterized protein involved in cysteine biosynthesis
MNSIVDAILRALRDLFQFKVLWIVIWPIVIAALLWLVIGVTFWSTFSGWISHALTAIGIQTWLEGIEPRWIANGLQAVLHLLLFVPMVFLTALVITSLFAMTALIRVVEQGYYPQLNRENGGSMSGVLLNTMISLSIFIMIWVLTLPLWLIGVGFVVPFIAAAYLNQRMFRFDALSEHASSEEMKILFDRHQSSWWGLGLLTGFVQFVPILNLLAPVLTALVFIHYGLARLSELRQVSV